MKALAIAITLALPAALTVLAPLVAGGCEQASEARRGEQSSSGTDQQPVDARAAAPAAQIVHAALHPSHDPNAPCTCADAKERNGWCSKCNVGYIAGRRVEYAKLFETLDPHGHDFMLESLKCPVCHNAAGSEGYCDDCRIGFVHQMAYFTRLTYGLAQGRTIDPASLSCAVCRANMAESGWCDACGRGMVGNVAYSDRAVFDSTAREYKVLLAAIERAPTCEICACAMVVHRSCPICGISYELNQAAQPTSTGPGLNPQ